MNRLSLIFMNCAAVAMFTACSNNDLGDLPDLSTQKAQEYAEQFSQKYPNVSLNQNWDYSDKATNFSLSLPQFKAPATRAGGGSMTKSEDWYEVDLNMNKWMQEQLKELENNKKCGNPFYLTVPSNHFSIVPVYMGRSGADYELHAVIGEDDYLVWKKHENIEFKDLKNTEWHSTIMRTKWSEEYYNNTTDYDNGTVTGIRAKSIEFNDFQTGMAMHFYLKITKPTSVSGYHNAGAEQSSLNHMMIALKNVPRPSNISEEKQVILIGAEDSNLKNSDWDYNDIVFMIVGDPSTPPIKEIENDTIIEKITVRYMVEDLGSIGDFDFNDIVVDVLDFKEKVAEYDANKAFTGWNETKHYQKAVLRHLGGKLPFNLTIGDTKLPEMGGPSTFKTSPNTEYDITGWDMNTNNIYIEVQGKDNTGVCKIKFPKAGEAPMIIATNTTQEWMKENVSVPAEWFYIPE